MVFFLFSLSLIIPLILAIYVIIINLKELESKLFIGYMAVIVVGSLLTLLPPIAHSIDFARWGNAVRLIFVFYLNGIFLFFLTAAILFKEFFRKKALVKFLISAPVIFSTVILSDYFFSTGILYSGVKFSQGVYFTEFGRFRFLNDIYILSFALLTFYILIRAYPVSDPIKKKAIIILTSLILLSSILSSLRPFLKQYPLITLMLSTFGPLPVPVAFAYLISKYKLFSPIESALNLAIETLMDGIIVLNQNREIIKMNPMAEKILDLKFADIKESSSSNFQTILEEKFAGEELCDIFKYIFQNEKIEIRDRETELKKSREAFLEINVSQIKEKGTKLLGTLVKIRDITEKKKSEIALNYEKEMSANILENVGLLVLATSREAEIIFCNKKLEEITGYTKEEIQKYSFAMLVFTEPKYRRKAVETLYKPYMGEITKDEEFIITRKNGEKRTISFTSTPINDLNGNFLGVLISGNDITEKRRAEESLKLLANLTYLSVDGIISTDENGIIISWNRGAEKIYGYTYDEIFGKSIRVLDTEDVRDTGRNEEFLKNLREKGFVTNIERIQVAKDARFISVQITAFVVRDEIEEKNYYASIVRDVTQTRMMEEELNQSSKLAAIGTLAAGVAHEFNNLLAGILGYAQLGKSSTEPEQMKKALEIIFKTSEKAKNISQNLLSFARKQEQKKKLNDIKHIIENTLGFMEREFDKAGIKVVRDYIHIPLTVCDFGQISQVFLNLMTNAKDAMTPCGGTLTIKTRQVANDIEISFSDTGCGIPKELIDKIFEPFMTTKGPRSGSKTPGIGLGLSVSYGIIKSHNGTIKVESKVCEGSTFIIKLPVVSMTNETFPTKFQKTDLIESTDLPVVLNTLVVDDEEVVRFLLRDLLEQEGHKVVICSDGKTALDMFKNEKFNIVITDITMPGMNGIELLKEIKKIDRNIPVVLITGKIMGDKKDMINIDSIEEASGFIEKPFNISDIKKVLIDAQRKNLKASEKFLHKKNQEPPVQ